jgi:adenylate cyclase
MGWEIERKFLLRGDAWRAAVAERVPMSQGYIARSDRTSVRVRLAQERGWLNIKSGGLVASRQEFEYPIPTADALELLALATGPLIEKTRHIVPHQGFEWEIDEFHGANSGLVVAEIELDDLHQEFPLPKWIGAEVTHLARYYNVNMVKYPYSAWTEAERRGA